MRGRARESARARERARESMRGREIVDTHTRVRPFSCTKHHQSSSRSASPAPLCPRVRCAAKSARRCGAAPCLRPQCLTQNRIQPILAACCINGHVRRTARSKMQTQGKPLPAYLCSNRSRAIMQDPIATVDGRLASWGSVSTGRPHPPHRIGAPRVAVGQL